MCTTFTTQQKEKPTHIYHTYYCFCEIFEILKFEIDMPNCCVEGLTLKSTFFFNSKECLLIGFYAKMDLYSQPT